MNKILLVATLIVFSNCKSQDSNGCSDDSEWLLNLLEHKNKAVVFTFKNDQLQLIEFHHCFQCPDAIISFYDCDGNKICDQGGFLGSNDCPDFDTSNKVKIYPKTE